MKRRSGIWLRSMTTFGVAMAGIHLVNSAAERDIARHLYPYGPLVPMAALFLLAVVLGFLADLVAPRITGRYHFIGLTTVIAIVLYLPVRFFVLDIGNRHDVHPPLTSGELVLALVMCLIAGVAFGLGMWKRVSRTR